MDKVIKIYFSTDGRLGRVSYIQNLLTIVFVCALYYILTQATLPVDKAEQAMSGKAYLYALSYILLFPVACYAGIVLSIKRLHDVDLSGWWVLLFLLPLLNLFLGLYLLFLNGDAHPNRFDKRPVPPPKLKL